MTTLKIPISIGFELETQYLCPVLIDKKNYIKDIDNENPSLIDYKIWSTDNAEFVFSGDQFTKSTDFAKDTLGIPFSFRIIKTRKIRARKHDINDFMTDTFFDSLRNAEFINTFYKNEIVSINNIWKHIINKLQKSVNNIKEFLLNNKSIEGYYILETDFPYKYFYKINNPDLVTNNLNRIKNERLNTVLAEKQTLDKFDIYYDKDEIDEHIENIKNNDGLKNINDNCIGIYSQGPIQNVIDIARFVPQCTLGFPIIYSIDVMTYLYNLVKNHDSELELLNDFQMVLDKIPYFKRYLKPSTSRNVLLLNYIFLFYYSVSTRSKRKKKSLFSIRANFQFLMYLLTTKEKEKIYNIIDDDDIKKAFDDIHFKEPYLSRYEMVVRQRNLDVHTLQSDELNKLHLTPIGTEQSDKIAKQIDYLNMKILIEFRMLNFVITSILDKSDATLNDILRLK